MIRAIQFGTCATKRVNTHTQNLSTIQATLPMGVEADTFTSGNTQLNQAIKQLAPELFAAVFNAGFEIGDNRSYWMKRHGVVKISG